MDVFHYVCELFQTILIVIYIPVVGNESTV